MICSAVEFIKARLDRTWLVIGQGPTADLLPRIKTRKYRILTLNRACRLLEPDLAHFVDWHAFVECLPSCTRMASAAFCLPWRPHVGFAPSEATLEVLGRRDVPRWREWSASRVYSYNATTALTRPKGPGLPWVRLRWFSATGAFNLLADAGVREIHSLGIDGGTGYGKAFDPRDNLANGQPSYRKQWAEIARTLKTSRVKHTRLADALGVR